MSSYIAEIIRVQISQEQKLDGVCGQATQNAIGNDWCGTSVPLSE